jgi:predicted RNase H-like nuclease (RuvC/YqgF family)
MPQSSDPATFLELVRDYVVPAGGPLGVAIGWFVGRRRSAADARKIEKEADILVSDAMTRQFQALIGGYELRISDLTAEVHSLREEVKNLRVALDSSRGRVIDGEY